MVSHVGFVIKKGKKTKIRHATILGQPKSVKEHNLKWYLRHLATYKWKVAGVAILLPKVPTDQPHMVEDDSNKYEEVLFEDVKTESTVDQKKPDPVDHPKQIDSASKESP